jgi:hypothetical protein
MRDLGPGRIGSIHVAGPDRLGALRDKVYAYALGLRPLGDSIANFPFAPEPGGAIAWAEAADGRVLAWAPTSDDPDRWPVIAIDPDWMAARELGMTMTSLIYAYLEDPAGLRLRRPTDADERRFSAQA